MTRQEEKKHAPQHVQQHHHHQQQQQQPQTSNVIPRRLQEEIRHTPVEKDSASLLEQEMKKRPSKIMQLTIFLCCYESNKPTA